MGNAVKRRRVVVTQRAAAQLNATADWIAERAPATAEKWFAEFAAKLKTLDSSPERCPRARESRQMPFELRELLIGRRRQWRVLFTIREDIVLVMAIRHAAQNDVTLEDLTEVQE
jgi:plasmid stabilization system protein ParE